MKHQSYVMVLLMLLTCNALLAQESSKTPDGITSAFRTGNATELSKYLNSTVEILLLDKEDFYKKSVAESIFKDFFNTYKSLDFMIRHQGSRNDAQYVIGSLTTDKGSFRVYFLLKTTNGQQLIQQIRIESENER